METNTKNEISPKVSVIIPVYNVEQYLRECLDSVVNQTLRDIEIICIDDCSTDNSLEILKKYEKKDNRFLIVEQAINQGQGVARNKGVELARGEFIAFVDPDDWLELNAFEKLYDYSLKNNAKIVHFNHVVYRNNCKEVQDLSAKIKKIYNYDLVQKPYYSWKDFKKGCLTNLELCVWSHFYSANFIKSNNIKCSPTRLGEDHLFAIGAKLSATRVYYLNENLYFYRFREGSAVNNNEVISFDIFSNTEQIKQFLIQKDLFQELMDEFENYKKTVLFWQYRPTKLKETEEYEKKCAEFLGLSKKDFLKLVKPKKKFTEKIFSLKNRFKNNVKYKVITIFGIEFVLKTKDMLKTE